MSTPTQKAITSLESSLRERESFQALFTPQSVAVIGATDKEGSVGLAIMKNLIASFKGAIYPVNPKRTELLALPAFPNIAAAPAPVDLAVIITPARTVPGLIRECIAAGVKSALIISAGFKEVGPEGVALEKEILEACRAAKMRFVGPNCLGIMNPGIGLNATFADSIAQPGRVYFAERRAVHCRAGLEPQ